MYYLMGKYVFERPSEGDDQKNTILATLIDCHDPGRIVPGESNIHSCPFHNTEQFSIDVFFNSSYIKAKINSLLTCLCRVHFLGMATRFLSCRWIFIALHSVYNAKYG